MATNAGRQVGEITWDFSSDCFGFFSVKWNARSPAGVGWD